MPADLILEAKLVNLSTAKRAARLAYAQSLKQPLPQTVPIRSHPEPAQARAVGYERNPPHCANCVQFMPAKCLLHKHTNRLPVITVPPICKRGRFHTTEGSICDMWTGRDGSTLE